MASKTVSSCFRKGLFAGKTAIVTGGATGIGRSITEELLHLGCEVMIASRKLERLSDTAADIKAKTPPVAPAKLEFMQCNIRNETQVQNLIQSTIKTFGKVDLLINNAGGQFPSNVEDISTKGWNAVIDTNLTGTFICCREAYNQWMGENGGAIVNIIADMYKGFPMMCHTGAARAAVENMTKTMSIEWASSGIRVNAVAPGSSIYSETAAANYSVGKEIFEIARPNIPAKRLGTTYEISAAVCFLLSPAAAFISGETLYVDGAHRLYNSNWKIPDHNKLPAYTWDKDHEERKKFNPSKL